MSFLVTNVVRIKLLRETVSHFQELDDEVRHGEQTKKTIGEQN